MLQSGWVPHLQLWSSVETQLYTRRILNVLHVYVIETLPHVFIVGIHHSIAVLPSIMIIQVSYLETLLHKEALPLRYGYPIIRIRLVTASHAWETHLPFTTDSTPIVKSAVQNKSYTVDGWLYNQRRDCSHIESQNTHTRYFPHDCNLCISTCLTLYS